MEDVGRDNRNEVVEILTSTDQDMKFDRSRGGGWDVVDECNEDRYQANRGQGSKDVEEGCDGMGLTEGLEVRRFQAEAATARDKTKHTSTQVRM